MPALNPRYTAVRSCTPTLSGCMRASVACNDISLIMLGMPCACKAYPENPTSSARAVK